MKIEQKIWTETSGWQVLRSTITNETPQLVLVFGGKKQVTDPTHLDSLHTWYPNSNIILGSTAGEIADTHVRDNSLSCCAIAFEKTALSFESGAVQGNDQGEQIGAELAQKIKKEGLRHVMVFCDGLKVKGADLVKGLSKNIPADVVMTGGLVGDGSDMKETVLGLNTTPQSGQVVLVGFYGDNIKIGYGSMGGWDSFGPARLVTKSNENVLYELDGKPALTLYKQYLGDKAKDLPESGLLFPLDLHTEEDGKETRVVRTALGVNEENQSLIMGGDIPEGSKVTLMKANFDKLVDGAGGAANMSNISLRETNPDLAILISCIGRKLVLKARIEEETEAVKEKLGDSDNIFITGFYSYGEISPVAATEKQCKLHNQTMTITTFKEV